MASKELKKLSRRELVDIIYQMKKNEQLLQDEIAALHNEVAALQESLQDKRILLSSAGSIAEAALSISNVFSSAQNAADLYLQEIARMKRETEIECAKMLDDTKQKSAEMIARSKTRCAVLNDHCRREYAKWSELVQLFEKTIQQTTHED